MTDLDAMHVALVAAIPLAAAAATVHTLSSKKVPLPARAWYQLTDSLRSVLGRHPLERFMVGLDPTSRRENFLVCFGVYFLAFVVIGYLIWFAVK